MSEQPLLSRFGDVMLDQSAPIHFRFRALFTLRNFPDHPTALEAISKAIEEEKGSDLFKHEAVYCLGQMQANQYVDLMKQLVADVNENAMVRHEAAEALGVIGFKDREIANFLQKYKTDKDELVRDTCELAVQRIDWSELCKSSSDSASKFDSFDPTPPHPSHNVDELKDILTNSKKSTLFDRYRAMMALRDIGSDK